MPVDKLYEKAKRLVESRRVEPLGQGIYNVIGDHGTYTVVEDITGKLSCNCIGFLKKAKCSHIAAVIILTKMKKHNPTP
ncbi:MAG: SWIM zinc finger family protein [Candidatus Bathyarchaeales archaeon]